MDIVFKHCSVSGCNRNAHRIYKGSKGMCNAHYERWRKYGDPRRGMVFRGEAIEWIKNHSVGTSEECLGWPYSRNKFGYGIVRYQGKTMLAHRVMCLIAHGKPENPKMDSAHYCGNGAKGCVNPRHLRWDTRAGNCADKLKHGTDNRGTKSPNAKLTNADVDEIKKMRGKVSQMLLAKRFGVDQSNICKIQLGKSWSY